MKLRHLCPLLFLLALAASPAAADEKTKPLSVNEACAEAVAAFEAEDKAKMAALAAQFPPDPWRVADRLVRGEHIEVAVAYADAAKGTSYQGIPAYVAARKSAGDAKDAGLEALKRALGIRDHAKRLAALGMPEGPPVTVADVDHHYQVGFALLRLRRFEEALEVATKAAAATEKMGWLRYAAELFQLAADCTHATQDWDRTAWLLKEKLRLSERIGDTASAASATLNLGLIYYFRGRLPKARSYLERAVVQATKAGARFKAAGARMNLATTYHRLADYPAALRLLEMAIEEFKGLGRHDLAAQARGNLANIYEEVGQYEKAQAILEEIVGDKELAKDPQALAIVLVNLAGMQIRRRELSEARETLLRAKKIHAELGDRRGVAITTMNLGVCAYHDGLAQDDRATVEEALELLGSAKAMLTELGDRVSLVEVQLHEASAQAQLGKAKEAEATYDRAHREALRLRIPKSVVETASRLAHHRLVDKNNAGALAAAQAGRRELENLLGGLGEGEAAVARASHVTLHHVGTLAAVRLGDLAEALEFLESGRAGALLESLGGRDALEWAELPDELRQEEASALAAEAEARRTYEAAVQTRKFKPIVAAGRALDQAHERIRAVKSRIQREAKRAAGLFYPRAAPIEEIQEGLQAGELLVVYALTSEAIALVVDAKSARVVQLGPVDSIRAAATALDAALRDPDAEATQKLAKLRGLLVTPLALDGTAKTLLISPEGLLGYVPFGALFDRPVALTPSGTTHLLLREDAGEPGKRVLALGDPVYGAGASQGDGNDRRGGRPRVLAALPGTRAEVKAIADIALLGADANTEALFAKLPEQGRWRAVHFACHGLVDVENPNASSLALSRNSRGERDLTAMQVIESRIDADLAVLSACETGRGRVMHGEGIVGFTRAFMYAGAPRVICSLWKVDDTATTALMVKFYELWNPKEGKGLGAAAALEQAQASIAGHEKWKHPFYWAAWVLWGLPN